MRAKSVAGHGEAHVTVGAGVCVGKGISGHDGDDLLHTTRVQSGLVHGIGNHGLFKGAGMVVAVLLLGDCLSAEIGGERSRRSRTDRGDVVFSSSSHHGRTAAKCIHETLLLSFCLLDAFSTHGQGRGSCRA